MNKKRILLLAAVVFIAATASGCGYNTLQSKQQNVKAKNPPVKCGRPLWVNRGNRGFQDPVYLRHANLTFRGAGEQ